MPNMLAAMKQHGGYWNFQIHKRDPPVQQCAVQLENDQCVYFTEDTVQDQASSDPLNSTLTEFFTLCQVKYFSKFKLGDTPTYLDYGGVDVVLNNSLNCL